MAEKLLLTGLALIAVVWLAGELKSDPVDGARKAVGMAQQQARQSGPNYLPQPKLPDPVNDRGLIDPRDFRVNGSPYPGDPADPGFCSAPGSGLPCDPPTP
jgi:hypothetical protein